MDHFSIASGILTCGIIIYTIFSIIPKLRQRRHLMKQASKFPGPPTLPIIGNAHLFSGSTEAIFDRFLELGKLYPAPYRLWLGSYLTFVISTPEQMKIVLLSPKTMEKGAFFDFVRPWLGTGLLSAPGPIWKVHRKLIQPTFSSTILQSFVGTFSAQSVIMAERLKPHLDGPEFDIYKYMCECTLHTVCETTMGVDLGSQAKDNGSYAEAIEQVIAAVCKRAFNPWLHPDFIFQRSQLGKDQQKNIEFLHAFVNNVIQSKKEAILRNSDSLGSADGSKEDMSDSWTHRRKVLLDHLLELSGEREILSDEDLREEIDTIMVAGSDTTALTTSFVMLMLASHPEIQDKVYQELCEIYEEGGIEKIQVSPADLTRMSYLDRVIKETLRVFPIAPFLTRMVSDDLDIGKQTLPAGSLLFLSMIELHRNEDLWPDPLKFDPDRFLPENVEAREPYSYLPFSTGPRNCIGLKYAMMSMKTLLATILWTYVLKKDNVVPIKDIRFKWEFLARPVDPITFRIERRKRKNALI